MFFIDIFSNFTNYMTYYLLNLNSFLIPMGNEDKKPRVLYVERSDELRDIFAKELRRNYIDFDVCGNNGCPASERFHREFLPRIGEYPVVITHLGVEFNGESRALVEANPGLHMILLHQFEPMLDRVHDHRQDPLKDRFRTYSIKSDAVFCYINDCLSGRIK